MANGNAEQSSRQFVYDAAALDAVGRELGLRMVVLFGSHAGGALTPRPDSDVDLAVRMVPGQPGASLWQIHDRLLEVFPGPGSLDLVLLERADPLLRWEVMRAGVLLWGDLDDFHEYRLYAYRDYVDSADLRALEHKLFEKKMDYLARKLGDSA